MGWSGGTYTRTNGTYTGATVWTQDETNSYQIESDRHDTHDQDLATGINTCLTKDGQNTPSAHIQYLNKATFGGTTGGSGGNYTVTLSPAATAYYTGMRLAVVANHDQAATTATLNVNGLGAKEIRDATLTAIPQSSIVSGAYIDAVYNGTYFILLAFTPIRVTTWNPTLTGGGGMTLSAVSYIEGTYTIDPIQRRFFFSLDASFTTSGVAGSSINIDITAFSARAGAFSAVVADTSFRSGLAYTSTATNIVVEKSDVTTWGLGAGRRILVTGSYLLA